MALYGAGDRHATAVDSLPPRKECGEIVAAAAGSLLGELLFKQAGAEATEFQLTSIRSTILVRKPVVGFSFLANS